MNTCKKWSRTDWRPNGHTITTPGARQLVADFFYTPTVYPVLPQGHLVYFLTYESIFTDCVSTGSNAIAYAPSRFHCHFWTEWPLTLNFCMRIGYDHSSPRIKGQGQTSKVKVKGQSVEPRSSIEDSFLVTEPWQLEKNRHLCRQLSPTINCNVLCNTILAYKPKWHQTSH